MLGQSGVSMVTSWTSHRNSSCGLQVVIWVFGQLYLRKSEGKLYLQIGCYLCLLHPDATLAVTNKWVTFEGKRGISELRSHQIVLESKRPSFLVIPNEVSLHRSENAFLMCLVNKFMERITARVVSVEQSPASRYGCRQMPSSICD